MFEQAFKDQKRLCKYHFCLFSVEVEIFWEYSLNIAHFMQLISALCTAVTPSSYQLKLSNICTEDFSEVQQNAIDWKMRGKEAKRPLSLL